MQASFHHLLHLLTDRIDPQNQNNLFCFIIFKMIAYSCLSPETDRQIPLSLSRSFQTLSSIIVNFICFLDLSFILNFIIQNSPFQTIVHRKTLCYNIGVNMHTGIEYWISNTIITIFWMTCANFVLSNRYPKLITIILESLINILCWYFTENFFAVFSSSRFFFGIIILIALFHFFHSDSIHFKVVTAIAYYLTTGISEFTLAMMLPWDKVISGEIFETNAVSIYSVFLFINLIVCTLVSFALYSYKNNFSGYLNRRQKIVALLFPLSQLASMSAWSYPLASQNSFLSPGRTIFIIVLNILANISLHAMLSRVAKNAELSARNKILEEEIRTQEYFYKGVSSKIEDVRKMRHDIDNHLYTMQALIKEGKTKEASDYLSKIIEEDDSKIIFPDCKNMVVTSYLAKKLDDLKAEGIELIHDIHIPESLKIPDPDLICILGNVINNAQEAVSDIEDKKIFLGVIYKEPYLTFSCKNHVSKVQTKERRIKELERGLGTSILDHLAHKYEGYFRHEIKDEHYLTSITIKNKEAEKLYEKDQYRPM